MIAKVTVRLFSGGGQRPPAPAFLAQGFRPFFLAAAVWSAAALALWIVMLATGTSLPSRFEPLAWHIHEMLFGFVMAAVAGFLLTAVPNWTQRRPVSGAPLAWLAALWLLGRAACLVSALLPAALAVVADLAFPVALIAVVARELVAGGNRRNLPMVAPVAVLGIANLLMHLEADGVAVPAGLGWRIGLAAVIVLISVVGGRIVPSFTRNWLAKRPHAALPAAPGGIDRAALGLLHAGVFAWALLPAFAPVGILLLMGAAVNAWRLLRWRGIATATEPLLLVLHVGYAWLVFGVALLGASMLWAAVPQSAAIHALTAGAIGTMIPAVMTRATRGHTGRALSADAATSAIYLLVTLAAIARIAAAFATGWAMPLLVAAAGLWITAFTGFALFYGPMLLRPSRRS
jgi:uncharacterized protein involved in response to NO